LRNKAQGWRAEGVKKLKIAEIRCRKSLIPKGRRLCFGRFFQFFHTFAAPTLGKRLQSDANPDTSGLRPNPEGPGPKRSRGFARMPRSRLNI